ncbi:MAG: GNAT family N-acetyltransferase, partial [Saprospiraceae bacterium]|nr:GNAT family N-acetyltransferase [Saprospiraceae bacterium]
MEIVNQRVYYPYDPSTPKSYIESFWVNLENTIYLAEEAGQILGAYILRPNQPAYGKHIANAAYMVSTQARGKGIGRMLGLHSLNIAREAGYHGMQFNFVVSTNENAVHLWKSIGFEVVGRAPDAFHHPEKGYVDALIMYQKL